MKDTLLMLIPRFRSDWTAFSVGYWEEHEDGSIEPHDIQPIALVEQLDEDDPQPELVAQMKSFSWMGVMFGRPEQGVFFDWNSWVEFAVSEGIMTYVNEDAE